MWRRQRFSLAAVDVLGPSWAVAHADSAIDAAAANAAAISR